MSDEERVQAMQEKHPECYALIKRAEENTEDGWESELPRAGFLDIFMIILDKLMPFLDRCFTSERRFVNVASKPNEFHERRLLRMARRQFLRANYGDRQSCNAAAETVANSILAQSVRESRVTLEEVYAEIKGK